MNRLVNWRFWERMSVFSFARLEAKVRLVKRSPANTSAVMLPRSEERVRLVNGLKLIVERAEQEKGGQIGRQGKTRQLVKRQAQIAEVGKIGEKRNICQMIAIKNQDGELVEARRQSQIRQRVVPDVQCPQVALTRQ